MLFLCDSSNATTGKDIYFAVDHEMQSCRKSIEGCVSSGSGNNAVLIETKSFIQPPVLLLQTWISRPLLSVK